MSRNDDTEQTDMTLQRYLITIEYDGSGLVGWQRQDNGPSVQEYLEEAAAKLCNQPTTIQGSGRTDAGVHAHAQAAHLDVPASLSARSVMLGLNSWLQTDQVSVLSAQPVHADFKARFDAVKRRYWYRILDRATPSALDRNRVWHTRTPLDAEAMAQAASYLVGRHDFTSFRASLCQANSPVRTLDRLDIMRAGDEIHLFAEARSFLHHQIRNFAGSLVQVGNGKWRPEKIKQILEAKDRSAAGPTAPPQGLYLMHIDYQNLD